MTKVGAKIFSRKKVEIKTKLNANTVEGDRLQLISLVHNIIENAVKYSEENSQVEVTLDFSKDSSVCIIGFGISILNDVLGLNGLG